MDSTQDLSTPLSTDSCPNDIIDTQEELVFDYLDVPTVCAVNCSELEVLLCDTCEPVLDRRLEVNSSVFVPSQGVVNSEVQVEGCVFFPPASEEGRVVEIFQMCIDGTCNCVNLIGGSIVAYVHVG